jgi:hypothetical protein
LDKLWGFIKGVAYIYTSIRHVPMERSTCFSSIHPTPIISFNSLCSLTFLFFFFSFCCSRSIWCGEGPPHFWIASKVVNLKWGCAHHAKVFEWLVCFVHFQVKIHYFVYIINEHACTVIFSTICQNSMAFLYVCQICMETLIIRKNDLNLMKCPNKMFIRPGSGLN